MTNFTINAFLRDAKKARRALREGMIPAVVYGPHFSTKTLCVSQREFAKIFQEAGTSQVVTLTVGDEEYSVLIHEIQRDPLKNSITHIDFYHFTKGHKVLAAIPLVFIGTSSGAKDKGGILVTNIREIEVEALPEKLPPSFEVSLQNLSEFGDEISVGNLLMPQGVECLTQKDLIIVSLLEPKREEAKVSEQAGEEKTDSGAPPSPQV
ncbi:MAG: 50S ribosomal protein L25 [Candidatus Portnoybacteria bacterium]|nr:50S ribosomal protein L25 [Candidatus Portnoybacteria bacterium]